jgi:hypothetical protein
MFAEKSPGEGFSRHGLATNLHPSLGKAMFLLLGRHLVNTRLSYSRIEKCPTGRLFAEHAAFFALRCNCKRDNLRRNKLPH